MLNFQGWRFPDRIFCHTYVDWFFCLHHIFLPMANIHMGKKVFSRNEHGFFHDDNKGNIIVWHTHTHTTNEFFSDQNKRNWHTFLCYKNGIQNLIQFDRTWHFIISNDHDRANSLHHDYPMIAIPKKIMMIMIIIISMSIRGMTIFGIKFYYTIWTKWLYIDDEMEFHRRI